MKSKTIELILSELMLATSGVIKKYGNPTVHPPEANKELDEAFHETLAQIQQLLEECLPEPTTALDGNEAQIFIMATDQYKSNLMEKLK